jgi:hypothetical protein
VVCHRGFLIIFRRTRAQSLATMRAFPAAARG